MGLFKTRSKTGTPSDENGDGKTERHVDKSRTRSVANFFGIMKKNNQENGIENGTVEAALQSVQEQELTYQSCCVPINVLELNGQNGTIHVLSSPENNSQPPTPSQQTSQEQPSESSSKNEANTEVQNSSSSSKETTNTTTTTTTTTSSNVPATTKTSDNEIKGPQDVISYEPKVVDLIISFSVESAKDLCLLSRLNKFYMEATSQDKFWRPLYLSLAQEKNEKPVDDDIAKQPYKLLYIQLACPSASSVNTPIDLDDDIMNVTVVEDVSIETVMANVQEIAEKKKEVAKPVKKIDPIDPTPFYPQDYTTLNYQEDPEENIVWTEEEGNKQIDSATLNKIVEELTSHKSFDNHFLHTFMITFRSFTDRDTLLQKLMERYLMPPPKGSTHEGFAVFKKEKLDRVRLRVTQTMKYWIEKFYLYDFDEEMLKKVGGVIEMMEKSNGAALANQIKRALENAQQGKGMVEAQVEYPPILTPKKSAFSFKKKKFEIMQWPLLEVARQITLIDFAIFRKIEPKECLNQAWTKGERETKAPNIYQMITRFNQLSNWAGSVIVAVEDIEKRAKVMCDFIQLGAHCKELNNFNSLFAIISGLSLAAIYRLKQTWALIPPDMMQLYKELNQYISRDHNFKTIRNAIRNVRPPCIPYIGLYLTDLTFIEDGNPKFVGGKINFVKCRKFAEVIRDLQTYQNTRYAYAEAPELRDQLISVKPMAEEDMYQESLKREARAARKRPQKPS